MSTFSVTVLPIRAIEPIPNADVIELAVVGDYRSIIKKGQFRPGDLVAYIPEAAIVPAPLLEQMGLTGRLAGGEKNRVKAIRLRGCLSQGLCLRPRPEWSAGQDVSAELGITKWIPPVPTQMSGKMTPAAADWTLKYDIENVKAFPDVLVLGEAVVFTEKIHGTWLCAAVLPAPIEGFGDFVVSSKGMSAQGLAFLQSEENAQNLYIRAVRVFDVWAKTHRVFAAELAAGQAVYLLGELFGVQDLRYGADPTRDGTMGFRLFDIYVGRRGQGRYLDDAEVDRACADLQLPRVPVLYRGPFSRDVMLEWTRGSETISGRSLHIREGIVIRPTVERTDPAMGRVQLKSVSEDYLLRTGDATEFE